MSPRRVASQGRSLGFSLLCLLGVGCNSDLNLPPIETETTHFAIRPGEGVVLGPRFSERLEGTYGVLRSALGTPDGAHWDYVVLADPESVREICADGQDWGADACLSRGAHLIIVPAAQPVHVHELVHAAASPLGVVGLFFEEGLATALDCGKFANEGRPPVPENASLLDVMSEAAWTDLARPSAASFVAMLLRERGFGTHFEFREKLKRRFQLEQVRDAYAEAYGEPLDTAVLRWQQEADGTCYPLVPCASEVSEHLAVGASQTLTVEGEEHEDARVTGTFILEAPARVGLTPVPDRFGSCDEGPSFVRGRHDELWMDLPTGRYWVSYDGMPTSALPVRVEADSASVSTPAEVPVRSLPTEQGQSLRFEFAHHPADCAEDECEALVRFRAHRDSQLALAVGQGELAWCDETDGECREFGRSPATSGEWPRVQAVPNHIYSARTRHSGDGSLTLFVE